MTRLQNGTHATCSILKVFDIHSGTDR